MAEHTHSGRRTGAPRRLRRPLWAVGVLLALVLLGALAWLALTATQARSEISQARIALSALRQDISAGDLDEARLEAAVVARHTEQAHRLTTGPAWWTAAQLPWLGAPVRVVRVSAAQTARLGEQALPGLVEVADKIDPSTLIHHGSVDVATVAAAAPVVQRAFLISDDALSQVRALPRSTWLGSVDDARAALEAELSQVDATLAGADKATALVPAMLGLHAPQRYFIGFQNSAEARGLGGLPGAFIIVLADHGSVTVTDAGDDSTLDGVHAKVDLGADFNARYVQSNPYGLFVNSDVSPDFSDAAQIWASMWQQKTGQKIDGAVTLDPVALSYLLSATGSVTLPTGETISSDNVVPLVLQEIYARYPIDPSNAEATNRANAQRKAFLDGIAGAVALKIVGGGGSMSGVIHQALHASAERRLLVWSADDTSERVLRHTSLSGTLALTGQSFSGVTVTNASGTKLDYYLDRDLSYTRTGCGAQREATATMTFTNSAPTSGLPLYVTQRVDQPPAGAKPGDSRLLISYYASPGSVIEAVTVDGKDYPAVRQVEKGLVVVTLNVELAAQTRHTLVVRSKEPYAAGDVQILTQPLARQPKTVVSTAQCS